MYPKYAQRLIELFEKFPGVGPRQAARFAFFVMRENHALVSDLVAALQDIGVQIAWCSQCFRSMEKSDASAVIMCGLCQDAKRDHTIIAVVEKEADVQNLERTGLFRGLYHVLHGVLSPLDAESPKRLHLKELFLRIQRLLDNKEPTPAVEVILATGTTAEGDTTALYIERILAPLQERHAGLRISRLGRGLSLGAELEYADEITLKNALTNRK